MKLITTTLIVASLSSALFAQQTLEEKKTKVIHKIEQRVLKIQNRKTCMQNALSLKEMQSCRVKKNQDKPFKLKEGLTFEAKKTKVLKRIDNHLTKIKERKVCIEKASSKEEFKACRVKKHHKKRPTPILLNETTQR